MKFCKDCRHIVAFSTVEDPNFELYSQCGAGLEFRSSPVSGISHQWMPSCHVMRSVNSPCGPEGKLFDPKPCSKTG